MDSLIRNINRLITLSAEEEKNVRTLFAKKRLVKKQFLLEAGEICRHENYVVKGSFRSFTLDSEGNEHTLHLAIEDFWITDLGSFMYESPSSIYIQALEASEVLQIERRDMDKLLSENPIFEKFFRILHQRAYIAQTRRILDSIALKGHERYLKLVETSPALVERIPQKYLASYLGMTPVFLSQIQSSKKLK